MLSSRFVHRFGSISSSDNSQEALRLDTIVLRLIREAGEDDVIPLAYPVRSSSGEMLSQIPVTKGQRIITSIVGYN
jgi:hypothetical protein